MSDEISKLVAIEAQHAAELESSPYPSTVPCLPPDVAQYAQEARVYLHACTLKSEVDRLVVYLAGRINGVEVDVAQLQPIPPRIESLEKKLDEVLEQQAEANKTLRELAGDVRIIASTVLDHGDAIENLRSQHAKNHPMKLSVVPPEGRASEAE